jgi:hypothetical protein
MAKNPLACYVALMTSQIGHSLPEICARGFEHLRVLSQSGRLDHLMEVMSNVTPLFFTSPDALKDHEDFSACLSTILATDQTLYKMAKEMIVADTPGPVMKEFGNMIGKQISSYKR